MFSWFKRRKPPADVSNTEPTSDAAHTPQSDNQAQHTVYARRLSDGDIERLAAEALHVRLMVMLALPGITGPSADALPIVAVYADHRPDILDLGRIYATDGAGDVTTN